MLTHIPVPSDAQLNANMLLLYFVMLCARFYSFACSVCSISLSCWFRGSRAEVVSRQFFGSDSVERLLVTVCFYAFGNTVKFTVMQIKILVVFMALLLTTENLVLQDVKVTFQQDFINLMIMSRSDLH